MRWKRRKKNKSLVQYAGEIGDHFSWFRRQYELKFEGAHPTNRSTPGLFLLPFWRNFTERFGGESWRLEYEEKRENAKPDISL